MNLKEYRNNLVTRMGQKKNHTEFLLIEICVLLFRIGDMLKKSDKED